jgi:predicted dehydrogenase/threonine dehydrogenase-like Zn-dependent dehydrogenase
LRSGETTLEEVPTPKPNKGELLIRSRCSLVSAGTERMLLKFGKAGLMEKSRQQPEKVKQVIQKMKAEGVRPTLEAVFRKLDMPIPLGYSMAGVVVETGKGVTGFAPGDRVISNGSHAEYVCIPENLVARIPDEVTDEEASFTVVGAIALQGIRLISPQLGETVAVIGLGLIGLITAQLLKANGCKVIAFDPDEKKLSVARTFGIHAFDPTVRSAVSVVLDHTGETGADSVLITATASGDQVIKEAAQMCRKRGKIVLVGVVGLNLDRSDFYEKELTFQVSCSYGPGRYDSEYEEEGVEYPLPYVRWTENRNFQAVLQAMDSGLLDVKPLISQRVPFAHYQKIYDDLSNSTDIASLLIHPEEEFEYRNQTMIQIPEVPDRVATSSGMIAVAGAGNFADAMILPCLNKEKAPLKYIVSNGGLSATRLAKKYDIPFSTTDLDRVLKDDSVTGVVIATQHHLHAEMVIKSLEAGKEVFVEKPLAINREELDAISAAIMKSGCTVTVGFNRRFSPHIKKIKELIGNNPGPLTIVATMNGGFIPKDSWIQDLTRGGGRIIGEACHYIDLISYITDSEINEVFSSALGNNPGANSDSVSVHLKYKNGSLGILNYFANGHKTYPKERIELHSEGRTLILDDFISLYGYGFRSGIWPGNRIMKTTTDKGHQEQFRQLLRFWRGERGVLIRYNSLVQTTIASFSAVEEIRNS